MFSSASVVKQVLSPAFNTTTVRGPRGRIENKFQSKAKFFKDFALFGFEVIFIIEEGGS